MILVFFRARGRDVRVHHTVPPVNVLYRQVSLSRPFVFSGDIVVCSINDTLGRPNDSRYQVGSLTRRVGLVGLADCSHMSPGQALVDCVVTVQGGKEGKTGGGGGVLGLSCEVDSCIVKRKLFLAKWWYSCLPRRLACDPNSR